MRKILALLALLILPGIPAWGAVAVVAHNDTVDAAIDMTDVVSLSYTLTYTAGTNNAVFVSCHTLTLDTADGCSGVTVDGTAMTLVTGSGITSDGSGYDPYVEWWYILNPTDSAGGSGTGVLDIVATLNTRTTRPAASEAIHLSGVNQSTPFGDVETGASTLTSLSDTITTTTTNSIVIQANGGKGAAAGATQDNGQTEIMDSDQVGTDTFWVGAAYLAVAAAGNQTMGISSVADDDNVQSLVEVIAAPTSQIKSVEGVAQAQIKSIEGVTIAQTKSVEGVSNV